MSEEQQGVPWKWVAVTAVSIIIFLTGGIFSYILSTNSSQINELKNMIRDQNTRIQKLSDKISVNSRRVAAVGGRLTALRRAATRYTGGDMSPFLLKKALPKQPPHLR